MSKLTELSYSINLKKTQSKLLQINSILKLKMNNRMKITFDYYKNYFEELPLYWSIQRYITNSNILILGLKLDDEYVSTISCDIYPTHITISSKTHELFLNRKYNLLLRTIIVYICDSIQIVYTNTNTNINKIHSYILNPISEFTLLKYFNAKYCKKDKDILQIICDKNKINKAFEIFNQIISNYTLTI